jgi:hypothetical protein
MKRALLIIVAVLIVGAYVGGYWPQHRRLIQVEAQNRELQAQLESANARIRLGEVLGQALRVSDAISVRNFGEAASLSSAYFDRVRQEALVQPPDAKQALDRILQSRDEVTAALARTDQAVSAPLEGQQLELRKALGYPVAEKIATEPPK